jgi:hypothetical protein
MALKSKLTKTEFEALPDVLKEHYKASGDNYLLEADDLTELRTAKDRETQARKDEKERADRLQREKDEADAAKTAAELAKAKKDKDVETLEASYKLKEETAVNVEKANTAKAQKQLREILEDKEAERIANEISTAPALILPHVKARLRAELDGDKAITRVLDANGEISAKTMDDLKRELIDNPAFKAIIKASNASGGGAGGGGGSGGGADGKKLSEMSETERTALYRTDPTKFNSLVEADKRARAH